jgi:hypothetical protein
MRSLKEVVPGDGSFALSHESKAKRNSDRRNNRFQVSNAFVLARIDSKNRISAQQ